MNKLKTNVIHEYFGKRVWGCELSKRVEKAILIQAEIEITS